MPRLCVRARALSFWCWVLISVAVLTIRVIGDHGGGFLGLQEDLAKRIKEAKAKGEQAKANGFPDSAYMSSTRIRAAT